MQSREGERLGQVGHPRGAVRRPPGADLGDHRPVEAAAGQHGQHLGDRLVAASRDEVLVAGGVGAVGQVHVREPVAEVERHLDRVAARDRGVRQVERRVRVVVVADVPVGQVGADRSGAGPPREHVLDGEADVGLRAHARQSLDELPRVVALPAERRVHDDGVGAEQLGRRLRALQLAPRIGPPHPLRDEHPGVSVPDVLGWAGQYRFYAGTLVLLLVAIAVFAYAGYLIKTPLGRTLRAIRDNELVARSLGKDITRYRTVSILIGSTLCGFAGSLWVMYSGAVTPTYARFDWTFLPWLMILLGGMGSNRGALMGTFVFVTLDKLILYYKYAFAGILPFDIVWLNYLLLGLITILILIYRPEGIVRTWQKEPSPVQPTK